MTPHRNARIATTLACVLVACLTDHFVCDHIKSPIGFALLVLLNIALFTVAIWHFKKSWWLTSILIISMVSVPIKTKADYKPQVILCVIVGGAILIGGAFAGYKIYKCAKKVLHPPAPPTNAPPSNKPGEWDRMISDASPSGVQWTNLPAVDCDLDDSVVSSNWVDWEGNPIAYCFAGETNLWQTSTNLKTWVSIPFAITGWVSQVNGMDSNQVSILWSDGKPFATNWHRTDGTGTNAVLVGTLGHSFPVEKTGTRFFKLLPVTVIQ